MNSSALLCLASLLLAQLLVAFPTEAATPFASPQTPAINITANQQIPIDLYVYVPCALGGQGEMVYFSGTLHDLLHITLNAGEGYHYETHDQPQGLTGTGQTSGTKYQATGITRNGGSISNVYNFTYVNNFRMIGQGPGNNYLVHETNHVTVNANGTVTADVANFSIECK